MMSARNAIAPKRFPPKSRRETRQSTRPIAPNIAAASQATAPSTEPVTAPASAVSTTFSGDVAVLVGRPGKKPHESERTSVSAYLSVMNASSVYVVESARR